MPLHPPAGRGKLECGLGAGGAGLWGGGGRCSPPNSHPETGRHRVLGPRQLWAGSRKSAPPGFQSLRVFGSCQPREPRHRKEKLKGVVDADQTWGLSLRVWQQSLREGAAGAQSCLHRLTQPTTQRGARREDPRAAAPFTLSRVSRGAGGPRAHSGTLTFFRGCHFIIFVQPIRETSRCWMGAAGRCRAAPTPRHAASRPPR